MKYFFVTLLLLVNTTAFSQNSTSNKKAIEHIATVQYQQVVQRISNLTVEQKTLLQKIFDAYSNQLSSLQNKNRRKKVKLFLNSNKKKDKAVKNILTEPQKEEYNQIIDEWNKKIQQRKKRNHY
jgi:uncharacterized protein (UPF0335 family)